MIHNVTQIAFSACVPAILYFPAILHFLTILHFIPILMVFSRHFALSHGYKNGPKAIARPRFWRGVSVYEKYVLQKQKRKVKARINR